MSAADIIKGALAEWGLTELYGDVDSLFKEGLDQDGVSVRLQQSEGYKRRFAANEQRVKVGLAPLTPAQYLATEASYRQTMQSYGLPSGFWDKTEDFTSLIARDVSPQEVNERVKVARDAFMSADPGLRDSWRNFYGLTDGAGIAAVLDPERSLPIVHRMAAAAQAGASATRNGLEADRGRLETYVDQGFSPDQLSTAFSQIGQVRGAEQGMSARFNQGFDQVDSEAARIRGDAGALNKQKQLYGSEQALFEARASADQGSLNNRKAGSF